jgi:CBS domain-containing protein
MNVLEILKRKGSLVVTIRPSDSVEALSRLLRDRRIGAVVVSDDGITIDGVVSKRDVAYSLCIHKSELSSLSVSEIMTRNVITCSPDDDVAKVASAMHGHRIRHIPVVDGNRACGMVSIRDLLNVRVDELQEEAAMLRTLANGSQEEVQDR